MFNMSGHLHFVPTPNPNTAMCSLVETELFSHAMLRKTTEDGNSMQTPKLKYSAPLQDCPAAVDQEQYSKPAWETSHIIAACLLSAKTESETGIAGRHCLHLGSCEDRIVKRLAARDLLEMSKNCTQFERRNDF